MNKNGYKNKQLYMNQNTTSESKRNINKQNVVANICLSARNKIENNVKSYCSAK